MSTATVEPLFPADAPLPFLTVAQYLALDSAALRPGEYIKGKRIERVGASRSHTRITINLTYGLKNQLENLENEDCDVFGATTRVRAGGNYYYPDVGVVCGSYLIDALNLDTLTNPTVLIEILSDSTEHVDRGIKFRDYRRLPSLRTYILVAQDYPLVEQFERDENGDWRFREIEGLEGVVELPAIGCRLEMARIYRRVPLSSLATPSLSEPVSEESAP